MLRLAVCGLLQSDTADVQKCGWDGYDLGHSPDGIFVSYESYPPEKFPTSVKVIGTNCSMPRWVDRRVPVVTTRAPAIMEQLGTITPTAEFVIGQIMYLQRNMMHAALDPWGDRNNHIAPKMLSRQHMLLVGFGRIGQRVARFAESLGMPVTVVCDSKNFDMPKLIRHADVIVLTAHTEERIIDKECLENLKPTAIIVSIGHPNQIDQDEAVGCLANGKLRGLAMDCHTVPEAFHKAVFDLTAKGRLLLTPHIAGSTMDARLETEAMVLREMRRVVDA